MLTIVSITVVMAASQLSQLNQNNQTANQLSIMSLTMSMIVNFCLFWQHFMFTNTSSVYDFLRFPAITFFVLSFIFQMRVLQEVIKIRYREEERRSIRRRFIIFYIVVYASIIAFFIFQNLFLYNPIVVTLTQGCIWIPQIIQVYDNNRRAHQAEMASWVFLTLSQSFSLVYVRMCPYNLFEREPQVLFSCEYIMLLAAQLVVMRMQ